MKRLYAVFLLGAAFTGFPVGWAQTAPAAVSGSGVSLTDSQWKNVVAQFEASVLSLSHWLSDTRTKMKGLQDEIQKLEDKTARLRGKERDGEGVFDEFRLKGLLNDLKDKLERNSDLQHDWDEKQKEFEQKALSLISLYNDRIGADLEAGGSASQPSQLNFKLDELTLLIQKRNQVQFLLKQYQTKNNGENSPDLSSFGGLRANDRESLLLTLDLVRDRKKSVEEQIEKWSIEEDEVKNELKLQGKMQEFLEDIQRENEDSNFPHSSLKRNDLSDMAGEKERRRLEVRLDDLHQMSARGQASLTQLNQFMDKVQKRLDALGGEKKNEK
jgi:hypothetical protein